MAEAGAEAVGVKSLPSMKALASWTVTVLVTSDSAESTANKMGIQFLGFQWFSMVFQ